VSGEVRASPVIPVTGVLDEGVACTGGLCCSDNGMCER